MTTHTHTHTHLHLENKETIANLQHHESKDFELCVCVCAGNVVLQEGRGNDDNYVLCACLSTRPWDRVTFITNMIIIPSRLPPPPSTTHTHFFFWSCVPLPAQSSVSIVFLLTVPSAKGSCRGSSVLVVSGH